MPFRRASAIARSVFALTLLLAPAGAAAQIARPIGPVVFDAHAALARYPQPGQVATQLGVATTDLPSGGYGAGAGVHVYPLRWRSFALGIGASAVWLRGRQTAIDAAGDPVGPTVDTTLAALAPQLSLNFGARDGWSYISAGVGPAIYAMRLGDSVGLSGLPRTRAVNFGAGARWFARRHLAFSFDLRWYSMQAQGATTVTPAVPRTTRMVFTAGISIR